MRPNGLALHVLNSGRCELRVPEPLLCSLNAELIAHDVLAMYGHSPYALGKAVAASEIGGGRLIVVDAIGAEAEAFYVYFGFVPVKNCEGRLVMKVSTAAKALGERWRD